MEQDLDDPLAGSLLSGLTTPSAKRKPAALAATARTQKPGQKHTKSSGPSSSNRLTSSPASSPPASVRSRSPARLCPIPELQQVGCKSRGKGTELSLNASAML